MSPIRISPEREVYISSDPGKLSQSQPTIESRIVKGKEEVYVLPCGKGQDYLVRVEGFPKEAGGIVETERLTSGHIKDDIILTTPEDPRLSGELGVSSVKIDGVIYEATNAEESEEKKD